MACAGQQGRHKESDSIFNDTNDLPPEDDRTNDTKAYCVIMRSDLSGKALPTCTERPQNTSIHHEKMSTQPEKRIGTSIVPRLREKLGNTRCPDPEGGVEEHDPHPHHHEEKRPFEDHRNRTPWDWLRVLLELILWCISIASCWMMERLARPGMNPPVSRFVLAIGSYAVTTGTVFFLHSDSPFIDIGMVCSGILGMAFGQIMQWSVEETLFRLLPGLILSSMALSGTAAYVTTELMFG
ncbi:hypothetical protein CEP54_000195 [Fusarium duplospermum]|uniref:Uncharacterized protein n=1 Tax=Fusarium duplospermum TaxID=1325734 RepID=A0A428R821_9HYPO|nr:hypothetical protein CEP54_000195 [Fusarium duplospermum]